MTTEEMRTRLRELLYQRDMLCYERGEPDLYELREEIEDMIKQTQKELRMMERYESISATLTGKGL